MTGAFNETRTWYAYFPTEHKPEDLGTTYAELTLQPKSSYQVFWTPSDNRRRKGKDGDGALRSAFGGIFDQFTTSLNYLFFTPGDYKITAQVKYWDTPAATAAYRTAQKSTTIHLAAPQSVIMLGAIIGGLIAYTILPQTRRQRLTVTETPTRTVITTLVGRVFQQAYGLFGACLLSVIVTILLARISDTQFLVKVTVNDVWGAITIGFVANYAGSRVLDRLFPPQRTRTTIDETVPVEEATQAHEHREDIAANWQEAESPTQNDETRRDK
jgi:hypothetical protein